MIGHDDPLASKRMPPLLVAPRSANHGKAVTSQNLDHPVRSEPRRPALTNLHLEKPGIPEQADFPRRQIEIDSLADVLAGLLLGFAGRGAPREFGAHRKTVAGLGITFQHDPERLTRKGSHRRAAKRCGREARPSEQTIRVDGAMEESDFARSNRTDRP